MAKLDAPDSPFAAIILAKAGMVRLGWGDRITADLGPPTLLHAVLATAVFRCWHLLLFFAGWATAVSVISHTVVNLGIANTLLTVCVSPPSARPFC